MNPTPKAQIVITLMSNGALNIQAPSDPIFCLGLMELAKDAVKMRAQQTQQPAIETPSPAVQKALLTPNG